MTGDPPSTFTKMSGTGKANPSEGRRHEVLRVLRSSQRALSIGELARRLEVHPNTVRLHLESLTDAGQVERVEAARSGPGRPPLMFRASRRMDPAGPRNYRFLVEMLMAELNAARNPAARAVEIGRRWAVHGVEPPAGPLTAVEATSWLIGLLDRIGFAPEPGAGAGQIDLRNCPFLETVEPHDQLVCALHLGFMQGAVDRAGAVSVDELIPFAEPDVCRILISPRS
jgi:predicted ArsR family transcriptional regulator